MEDAFGQHAAVAAAESRQDRILDAVERREVDMTALGRLDPIGVTVAPDMRDAQPGAGADDADRAGRRQRFVGTAQSLEIARVRLRDGMARSEEHTSELQALMRISYAVICLKKK